ncbi:extracellular solute-binding protein [Asanoa sp. NPDC050611]|uniref:ABC transporter substrate-binding protein n=1 Tax=Asanoa sp. NPDC050611 TaxID=3157098 RepID=UPI00340534DD
MARQWARRTLVATLAVTLAAVAGCSGSGDDTQDGVTKVTIWSQVGGWTDIEKTFVQEFNAKNTGVQIDYVSMPADSIVDNLLLALRTGSGPDIFAGPGPTEVAPQGYTADLSEIMDDTTKKAYAPYLQGSYDFIYGGKLMGLPSATVTVRLMYNKDLFTAAGLDPTKPPTTYGEVKQAAEAITRTSNGKAYGYGLPLAFNGFLPNMIEPGVTGGNPDLTNFGAFNTKTGQFEMSAFKPAIQLFRDLNASKSLFPGAGTLNRDGMRTAFANGQIGMYVGNSLEMGTMNNQLKTKVKWGAAPVPVPDGQSLANGTAFTGTVWFVNAKIKNKAALSTVYNAWMGPGRVGPLQKAGVIFATNTTVRDDPQYKPADIYGYDDWAPGDIDKQPPLSPGGVVTPSGEPYSKVISALILGTGDIDGPLSDVSSRYNDAYQKAVKDGTLKAADFQK